MQLPLLLLTQIWNRLFHQVLMAQWWCGILNLHLGLLDLLDIKGLCMMSASILREMWLLLAQKTILWDYGTTQLKGTLSKSKVIQPLSNVFHFHLTDHYYSQAQMTKLWKSSKWMTGNFNFPFLLMTIGLGLVNSVLTLGWLDQDLMTKNVNCGMLHKDHLFTVLMIISVQLTV